MKKKNLKNLVLTSIFAAFVFALLIFFYSLFVIYKGVKMACLKAKTENQEECVDSLIKVVKSADKIFREKNSAIWTLGQLAETKALPFLYELDDFLPKQERCDYDEFLCKYEVQKAIKWCEKGNVASWMYRNRENWH